MVGNRYFWTSLVASLLLTISFGHKLGTRFRWKPDQNVERITVFGPKGRLTIRVSAVKGDAFGT